MGSASTPAWLDRELYPFRSRFLELPPGRLHYVDRGSGRSLLFLHGNPTWSFLFRDLIRGLSPGFRCVAPDLFGFGLSDKPDDWSYRPLAHARVIGQLVDRLRLERVTAVVHDWGGPIALWNVLRRPDRFDALVVMNSFGWSLDGDWVLRGFSRVFGGSPGRWLSRRCNVFGSVLMRVALADRTRWAGGVGRHYLAPHRRSHSRKGTWVFPRSLIQSSAWLRTLWTRRDRWSNRPCLILWGGRDPTFRTAYRDRWLRVFSNPVLKTFGGAGHYLPEDMGPRLLPHLRRFLGSLG